MSSLKAIFLCIWAIWHSTQSTPLLAKEKELYGADNRVDVYEDIPDNYRQWARASAALILWDDLSLTKNWAILKSPDLKTQMKVCPDEKFTEQPSAATCSGFLVAPDLVVTAGHCINPAEDTCGPRVWVFDFAMYSSQHNARQIPLSSIYFCKEVLVRIHDTNPPKNDLALIRLDRKVKDRLPLVSRTSEKIADGQEVIMIGHPSGLPTKIVTDGKVMNNNSPTFFSASLDAFSKNSGSAVLDAKTGVVEGILVRGKQDYEVDHKLRCLRPYYCKGKDCTGSEVTRITNFYKQSESTR